MDRFERLLQRKNVLASSSEGGAARQSRGSVDEIHDRLGNRGVQRLLRSESREREGRADEIAERAAAQPTRDAVRDAVERDTGRSLGDVNLYTDAAAAAALDARAFTAGRDIVFGEGELQPSTREGRRLLAHELAHVAQQDRDGAPAIERQPRGDREGSGEIGPSSEWQEIDDILEARVAAGSTARFVALRELVRRLSPTQAARLRADLSDDNHPLRKKMAAKLSRTSPAKIIAVIDERSEGEAPRMDPALRSDADLEWRHTSLQMLTSRAMSYRGRTVDEAELAEIEDEIVTREQTREMMRAMGFDVDPEPPAPTFEEIFDEATQTGDYGDVDLDQATQQLTQRADAVLADARVYTRLLKVDDDGSLVQIPNAEGNRGTVFDEEPDILPIYIDDDRLLRISRKYFATREGDIERKMFLEQWWVFGDRADYEGQAAIDRGLEAMLASGDTGMPPSTRGYMPHSAGKLSMRSGWKPPLRGGGGGVPRASVRYRSQQTAKTKPKVVSASRAQMRDRLMSEHPTLHVKTADQALKAAVDVGPAGQTGRSGDVLLAGNQRREVTVVNGVGGLQGKLVDKAGQGANLRELYIQVGPAGSTPIPKPQIRAEIDALHNQLPGLEGVRVRLFDSEGKFVVERRFSALDQLRTPSP